MGWSGRLQPMEPNCAQPQLSSGLERLTKPLDLLEADDGGGECSEGEMDVGAAFVADGDAPEAVEPSEGSLNHPAIAAEVLSTVDHGARDAGNDTALLQGLADRATLIGFVGV